MFSIDFSGIIFIFVWIAMLEGIFPGMTDLFPISVSPEVCFGASSMREVPVVSRVKVCFSKKK